VISVKRPPCKHLTYLFFDPHTEDQAVAICAGCPAREDCRAYAHDNRVEDGVWGGSTPKERHDAWKPMCQRKCGRLAQPGRSECPTCQRHKYQDKRNLVNA
jgi:hypothetical protein